MGVDVDADAPLMLLQHCFQILLLRYWFRAENHLQPEFNLLKSCALLKFKSRIILLHSRDLASGSVQPQKRKWDVCIFRTSILIFLKTFVSNVPLTFLAGKRIQGERIPRETFTEVQDGGGVWWGMEVLQLCWWGYNGAIWVTVK